MMLANQPNKTKTEIEEIRSQVLSLQSQIKSVQPKKPRMDRPPGEHNDGRVKLRGKRRLENPTQPSSNPNPNNARSVKRTDEGKPKYPVVSYQRPQSQQTQGGITHNHRNKTNDPSNHKRSAHNKHRHIITHNIIGLHLIIVIMSIIPNVSIINIGDRKVVIKVTIKAEARAVIILRQIDMVSTFTFTNVPFVHRCMKLTLIVHKKQVL